MLAILALLLSQSNKGITLTTRGESVQALLADASAQCGVDMQANGSTRNEIVIASVAGVAPDAFRAKLAESVGAEWRREGSVLWLSRSPKLERDQVYEERKLRVKEASEGVAEMRRKVAAMSKFGEQEAASLAQSVQGIYTKFHGRLSDGDGLNASIALEPNSPAGRLSAEILSLLSPEQVADVGPGDRIVYSTEPTAAQRPLAGDFASMVDRYLKEQSVYDAALAKVSTSEDWSQSWNPLLSRRTPKAPKQLMLVTSRSPYNDSLTVDVILVNDAGEFVGQTRTLLNMKSFKSDSIPKMQGNVALSPNSADFVSALHLLQTGKTFLGDIPIVDHLIHPEKLDPLSYVCADGLLGMATGKNLIACVPDEGFAEPAFFALAKDNTIDLEKFGDWLSGKCEAKQDGSWLTIRPLRFVTTRTQRVDRSLIGRFFRAAALNDGATLEDMSDLATQLPIRYNDTLMPFLAFFLLPELNNGITDRTIELLRVYGRLSSEQKHSLLSGQRIPVQQLDPESVRDLNYLVYRADSPISITFPPNLQPQAGPLLLTLATEVTSALPNGVPGDGFLSGMENKTEGVIMDGGDSTSSSYQVLNANGLAYALARAQRANPADTRAAMVNRYRYGYSRQISLNLRLTKSVKVAATVGENHFPRNEKSVAFGDLPQSFQDQVTQAKVNLPGGSPGKPKTAP